MDFVLVVIEKSISFAISCDMQAPFMFHLMLLPISRTRVTFLPLKLLSTSEGTFVEPFIYTGTESPIDVPAIRSDIASHPLRSGAPSINGGLASAAALPDPDAEPDEVLLDDPERDEVDPELEDPVRDPEEPELLPDVRLDVVPVLEAVVELPDFVLVPVVDFVPVVDLVPVVLFVEVESLGTEIVMTMVLLLSV